MLSATDFLPLFITMLMKRAISWLPCLGSGRTRRAGWEPLRDTFRARCLFAGNPVRAKAAVMAAYAHFLQATMPAFKRRPGRTGYELLLRALGAVLRASLAALGHASTVEAAAHGVVAHARQVLHTAAAN